METFVTSINFTITIDINKDGEVSFNEMRYAVVRDEMGKKIKHIKEPLIMMVAFVIETKSYHIFVKFVAVLLCQRMIKNF